VQSLGLTHTARLRQPAYKGLRPDLTAGDVDPADIPTVPDA
jgi:bifunctional non-homologous end joining protein LigD